MSLLTATMGLARRAASRQDLVLVGLLVLTVFMIILPMPTWMVDMLIGVNLSIVVLILVVSVYLKDAVDFSTLPAVILLCTLFRLAISISTTRLILSQADAGQIVETFGLFVVGGSLVVGLVIFLIITAVQFIVITKGAERVAEVAARFSLDALPGKQMAIDSDVRSGEIDMAEAKRRRGMLQTESEFYGAMDGAMKFVKGDAIAGLIIIAVNLLGGLGVGVLSQGMGLGEALSLYAILTVGDGLVSQIPALLVAISAGTVVTRVASDTTQDLGQGIASQLTMNPRTLQVAAVVLLGFALVPGFPAFVFLILGALFAGLGIWIGREQQGLSGGLDDADTGGTRVDMAADTSPIALQVAADLAVAIDPAKFREVARDERQELFRASGIAFPGFQLAEAPLEPGQVRLTIDQIPVAEAVLPASRLLVLDTAEHAALAGASPEEGKPMLSEAASVLVPLPDGEALDRAGIPALAAEEALARFVALKLPPHAHHFLGIQETRALLSSMEGFYGDLVKEALKQVPLSKISEVLKKLVEEGVSVRNLRIVLEALVEWGQKEKDVAILVEYVRAALGRQICHANAIDSRTLPAFLVEPKTEALIKEGVRHTAAGSYLSLGADKSRKLLADIRQKIGNLGEHKGTPVVLCSMDSRRFLGAFLKNNGIDIPIMSHQELAKGFQVQPLATISIR